MTGSASAGEARPSSILAAISSANRLKDDDTEAAADKEGAPRLGRRLQTARDQGSSSRTERARQSATTR